MKRLVMVVVVGVVNAIEKVVMKVKNTTVAGKSIIMTKKI